MNTDNDMRRGRVSSISAVLVAAVVGLAGCDFDVANPGPVADDFLNDPGAFAGIVGGVQRDLNDGFNDGASDIGIRTRELHGGTGQWWYNSLEAHYGTSRLTNRSSPWNSLQAARWGGEDGIRRLEGVLGTAAQSNQIFGELHLWTGYALRMLGEFYCETVVDGGPAITSAEAFGLAEGRFTTAMTIGTAAGASDVVTAAQAARASVRVNLGDWAGAVADATGIATDFEWVLPFQANSTQFYVNAMFRDQGALTVWNTFYEDYYTATNDPRTPWVIGDPAIIDKPPLPEFPEIPRFLQQKYQADDSPVQMSSGQEMRLIEAEALLRQGAGEMAAAMVIVNSLRTDAGMTPWPAPASLEEAWTQLRTERGIELWLEGRRLADRRRWSQDGTPGVLDPHETGTTEGGPDITNMVFCQPIPESETFNNPNFTN